MIADRSSPDEQSSRPSGDEALPFVVCLSDDIVVKADQVASRCFNQHAPHQVIATRRAPGAAAGGGFRRGAKGSRVGCSAPSVRW